MPHFGLIDDSLNEADASLLRARLHVRGGHIRLSSGRKEDGIAALYDAMLCGMLRFVEDPELKKKLRIAETDDLTDHRTLFIILQKSGIFNQSIAMDDFDYLYQKMDEAIEGELTDFNEEEFLFEGK